MYSLFNTAVGVDKQKGFLMSKVPQYAKGPRLPMWILFDQRK